MTSTSDRLKAIREERGYATARDAARAHGWDLSTYHSHENGARGITPDAAMKYARAFGFSLDWLYRGIEPDSTQGVTHTPKLAFEFVPRLSWNFKEKFEGVEQAMNQATEKAALPETLVNPGASFTMTVFGDSMFNMPVSYTHLTLPTNREV